MAGRNKQPLRVIEGKGRSHHITKEEAKKRIEHEERMRGSTDNIVAPTYLTAKQKREFDEIAEKLVALGIFSDLDIDNLARYIDSKTQYVEIIKNIKKIKSVEVQKDEHGKEIMSVNNTYSKIQRVKNQLFNECRVAASDLGLSITSRLKLVIPEQKDDKPKNKFSKFAK